MDALARYLLEVRKPGQTVNPLFAFLNVSLTEADPSRAVLTLPFRPEFLQGVGLVAGGVLAALADEAMAHVVMAGLLPGQKTATVEMSVRYLRAVPSGDLRAVGTVVHRGRRVVSAEAVITDEKDRVAVKAAGSFFVLDA